MNSIITIFLLGAFLLPPADIAMLGIKIGASEAALSQIKLKRVAQEENMIKYRTQDGNDFSITLEDGKVVYLENDWLQQEKGRRPLLTDFQFGVTSLSAIRQHFGTNGFTYTSRQAFTTATDLIQFNCFEFDTPGGEVLVIITKVSLKAHPTEDNVADLLKLDAIILTTKDYLDRTWGGEKLYDPAYRKIKP